MEATLRDILRADIHALNALCLVESIRVQGLVGDDVVFEKRLQVLLTVLGEQEGVDAGTEFGERPVGGCEECATCVVGVGDGFVETSLDEGELQGGELGGEELDDL